MEIIGSIIIGLLAGITAGWLVRGNAFSFILNICVGMLGSILGGWIYTLICTQGTERWVALLMSLTGAIFFLWVISFFKDKL